MMLPLHCLQMHHICCMIGQENQRRLTAKFPQEPKVEANTRFKSRRICWDDDYIILNCNIYFGIPIFSYSELEEATDNFASEKELGDGTVYYGKLQYGHEVAVKRLNEHNYERVKQLLNEIEILTRLQHKNLVSLYGCTSRRSPELILIYEYTPNGTVATHLHGDRLKSAPLAWPIRMRIAIETASALAYLHASDIIHRDILGYPDCFPVMSHISELLLKGPLAMLTLDTTVVTS
ncbi:wall-associated kinase, putative [Ricinus communis]|uniref:Wall-associated kinase, putative n=1 Tax=Ricinus communis TaxID=3988 RepID=B9SLZ6_RICCO|nr:wall-associated kinase, putative [Ricinus communis]